MGHKPPRNGPTAAGEQEREPGETAEISTDELYTALADHNRRLSLRYLYDAAENAASRQQLAEYISKHSSGPLDAEAVAIQLHHVHLPKLTETGIVEYEAQTGIVQCTPQPIVETHLDYSDGDSSR